MVVLVVVGFVVVVFIGVVVILPVVLSVEGTVLSMINRRDRDVSPSVSLRWTHGVLKCLHKPSK